MSKFLLIFVLMAGWIFGGWPQIGNFPPEIKEVEAADTGFQNPSGFVAGTWNDEANAYANDSAWATTGQNANVTSEWTTFDFSGISGEITGICVRIVGQSNQNKGKRADLTDIELSHNNGSNWTSTANIVTNLNKDSDATYYLPAECDIDGGDGWGRTWSSSEFSNANFQIKITGDSTQDSTLNGELNEIAVKVTYSTGPSTTFLIGGTETGTKDTGVTTITFPADAPESTICAPYNNVDGSGDPQVLSADASAPVVKIKNTGAATYNITLEITTWTNSLVNMEYYNLATDGATNISAVTSELSNAAGAARSVATGVSIDAGAYKDLYLKLLLGSVAGKPGESTLTVLGETP